jgi:hypothetical protein
MPDNFKFSPPYDIHVLSAWIANGAPVSDCK